MTWRAAAVGVPLMLLNVVLVFYAEPVRGGQFSNSGVFAPVLFLLFWLTAGNALVRRRAPRWALAPSELATVYVLLCVQTGISSGRLAFWILCAITYPFYSGTPTHAGLAEHAARLPGWLVVRDPDALRAFHAGGREFFQAHQFAVWAGPILSWSLFLLVLGLVSLVAAALCAPGWMRRERLTFPVVELPLQMVAGEGLRRERVLWWGFGLAAALNLLNGLHVWVPAVPDIPLRRTNLAPLFVSRPWSAIREFNLSWYPFIAGLSFLMPLDLSFSTLFFYFGSLGQRVAGSSLGLDQIPRFPYVSEQGSGAVLALSIPLLLAGWKETRAPGDDARHAVLCGLLLGGVLLLTGFLAAAGLSWWVAGCLVLGYLLVGVVVARIRAQLGFPNHMVPNTATLLTQTIGGEGLGQSGLPLIAVVDSFTKYSSNHLLPHQVEAFRLFGRLIPCPGGASRGDRTALRTVASIVLLALVISIPATFIIHLALTYQLGAGTAKMRWGTHLGQYTWDQDLTRWSAELRAPSLISTGVVGFSAALVLFLTVLRNRIPGFPLHPVGLALCEPVHDVWGAVLVGAVLKAVVLRYAGLRGYRTALPFFLGVILGDIVTGMAWVVVGILLDTPTYVFFL